MTRYQITVREPTGRWQRWEAEVSTQLVREDIVTSGDWLRVYPPFKAHSRERAIAKAERWIERKRAQAKRREEVIEVREPPRPEKDVDVMNHGH